MMLRLVIFMLISRRFWGSIARLQRIDRKRRRLHYNRHKRHRRIKSHKWKDEKKRGKPRCQTIGRHSPAPRSFLMRLSTRTFCIALASVFLLAFVLRIGLAVKFVGLDSPPDMDANPDQFEYELGAYQIVKASAWPPRLASPRLFALRAPRSRWPRLTRFLAALMPLAASFSA